jgi:hypothetical protein
MQRAPGLRRVLRYGGGWLVAAALAVGGSWAVIHDAVGPNALGGGQSGAVAPVPSLAPVVGLPTLAPPASTARPRSTATPGGSSGATPRSTRPAAPSSSASPAGGSPAGRSPVAGSASASAAPAASASAAGAVHSYPVRGGNVVLELLASSARLVSATPVAGSRVQSWEGAGWLRVDFLTGTTTVSSVFATWNGTPPTVQTAEY